MSEGVAPLLLNFLPIGVGGGLQNALSFLKALAADGDRARDCRAVVRRGGEVHELCRDLGLPAIPVQPGVAGRLLFEARCRSSFPRDEACFTIFGPPMLGSAGHLLNINGCAYSNLFYPEIRFWAGERALVRARREAVDQYRRWGVKSADYWIFETAVLARRAIELCRFPPERVGVVPMAVSGLVSPETVDATRAAYYDRTMPGGFRLLHLCSDNPNKRLDCLPGIAAEMRRRGAGAFVFVCTLERASPRVRTLEEAFASAGLSAHYHNLGPVHPADVASLIRSCNAMCTFSVLESFSNNFVEAWRMERPLIVTDADWARDACAGGAAYVDPEDAPGTAATLSKVMADAGWRERLVASGTSQLRKHPSAEEKNRAYLDHIARARALGRCPATLRRAIRWPAIPRRAPRRPLPS